MQTGQNLQVTNGDPCDHNLNVGSYRNPASNHLLPAGGQPALEKFAVEEAVPVRVTDNLYPWMGAWVVVPPTPYAAVTKPDGSFEIPAVPVGEIEMQLWHEKTGPLAGAATALGKSDAKGRLKVEVKAAGTDLGNVTIAPDALRR